MRTLRIRALLLVGVVALLPLVILGALSISRARSTLLAEVDRSDHDLALRAASEIDAHVVKYAEIIQRVGRTLSPSMHLSSEQAERLLKHYRLDVRDLRQLDYVGPDGREIATGRADGRTTDRGRERAVVEGLAGRAYRSEVTISQVDLIPEMVLAEPQRSAGEVVGVVLAVVDLTEMWRVIDGIKVGRSGYARVVAADGTLLAVGKGALKPRVFTREKDRSSDLVGRVTAGESFTTTYRGVDGAELFAVGVPIGRLGWGLILEQPLDEALTPYRTFTSRILIISVLLLAVAAAAGVYAARSVVRPIEVLRLRAGEIARGLLDRRVQVASPAELHELAEAMNGMCADLIRLQDDVKKKERIATLGRLAAGLAHDLKHPVRALQVNAKLILQRPDDPSVRELFGKVVQREFVRLESFLDDLKRVSRDEPMSFARERMEIGPCVEEFVREQAAGGAPALVEVHGEVCAEAGDGGLFVDGNRELLRRVLANLASNAYEAMEGEGTLRIRARRHGAFVEIDVGDTGPGIPPERVAGLFNDFETTKRRGLGLGLAVCKKIAADHGGAIAVRSTVGEGTHFVVTLPTV